MNTRTASPLSHRVLFNHDLLHGVFSHLHRPGARPAPSHADDDKPGVEEATLARAARVCKTFADPALAALWSSLPNLLPLWFVLEPLRMMGETAQPPQDKFRYILTDEISSENWSRFRQYAALIREVRADQVSDSRIDESVWLHLVCRSGGDVFDLFPRLHSLSYALIHPHRTSILLLLSPSLRKLGVYCLWHADKWGPIARQEAAVGMLMRAVCTKCPQLDDLKLSMLEYPGPLRVAAEGLRHTLHRLELGSVRISDAETIRALAEITTLDELREIHVKFVPTERLSVRGFRALKDLSIICDAAEDASKLLACVMSPLESLAICSFAPSSSWEQEFPVFVPMVRKSLKFFRIELLPEPTGNPPETLYMTQLVEPLLPLRNLEAFTLIVRDTGLITDDTTFAMIAKAYPQLTSFLLDGGVLTSSTTLTALRSFAQECPFLHTLLLPHLTDEASVPPLDAEPLPSQGALRWLSFYLPEDMTIREPRLVGEVISKLFPNLDVRDACRTMPIREHTPAEEDEDPDEEHERERQVKRDVGLDLWHSVLDVVEEFGAQGGH